MNDLPIYRKVLDVQKAIINRQPWSGFVDGSDVSLKIGVKITEFGITESGLLKWAIKIARNLEEIHKMASAGCPQNADCEEFMETISILAGSNK